MNAQNAAGQSAVAGLKRSQAMRGLGGSNIALTQEAGLRGQLATGANTAAFQQAMGLAGQRAGMWGGQSPAAVQPNMNMTNAFMAAVQQGLLANALAGNGGKNALQFDPNAAFYSPANQSGFGLPFNPSRQGGIYG